MEGNREGFGSRTAAILAMAGSAIGLGNIWRFPYMVGQYGGAAFIVVYFLSAVFLCVPIFISEGIIGKRTQLSPFGAMEKLAPGSKWKWLGLLTILTAVVILSYYSVVGGWSLNYLFKSFTLGFDDFSEFIVNPYKELFFHTAFLLLNLLVVSAGVQKGIEKFTKISTPVLFVLIVLIVVYSLTLPGAMKGVEYLVKPDFSKLTPTGVLSAVGQSFFSLSLGMGCILTYASYMKKEERLTSAAFWTAGFDLAFALLAGFAILPAVFSAGIAPSAGPGLIFETLPYIFRSMSETLPVFSDVVAVLFFLTILVAALTSSISMFEVGVAFFVDEHGMNRKKATALVFIFCWILGSLCALSFGNLSSLKIVGKNIFEFLDMVTSNYLMVLGSLLFVVFVGWRMKKADVMEELPSRIFYYLIRYVAPVAILAIFLSTFIG